MSSQHKAPLAAFVVVSIACIVVVVNALRSDALSGFFVNPTQVVVAGARLIPEPQDVLAAESAVVSDATAGLAAAPHVARHVVAHAADLTALAKPKQHRHHRASSMTASTSAAPPVVPTPAAPALHQTAPSPVSGWTSHAQGGPGAVAHHAQSYLRVMHVSSYGRADHRSDAALHGHSERGHGRTKPKNGEHLGASGHWSHTRAGLPIDSDHGSSRDHHAHGNDGRGNEWSHDSPQQSWSRGSSHDDWARGSHDHHGRH